MLRHVAESGDARGLVGGKGDGRRMRRPYVFGSAFSCNVALRAHKSPFPDISANNPSVSFSTARMSARISSSVRIGSGL